MTRAASSQRGPSVVHCDLHHGNVLTADRVYFIDWEYAQVGDPLLDLACVMTYYPRAMAHGALLLEASGLAEVGATPAMLGELTNVFTLLTYLWYRARRVARVVPATDLQVESAALRRLLSLAPDAQPRHTSAANLREISGVGKRNGDVAGD
jgi:aminoglycoside phosphotransferase (APT) family kinase protein